jgi:hypothetical protein
VRAGDAAVVAAGEVAAAAVDFVEAGDEVFGAAGELCAWLNPAGRRARRAIAKSGLIGFIEKEPFFFDAVKEARSKLGTLSETSDIGATRADSFC